MRKSKFGSFREPDMNEVLSHTWEGKRITTTYLGGGRNRMEDGREFDSLSGSAKAAAILLGQKSLQGINGKVYWHGADGKSCKRRESRVVRVRADSVKRPPVIVVGEKKRERAADNFIIVTGRREADRIVQKLLTTDIEALNLKSAVPGMTLLALYNMSASRRIAIG